MSDPHNSSSSSERKRATGDNLLFGVQYLRGAAVLLVVMAHANSIMAQYAWGSPFPIEEAGRFGVAVFFVISGFIVATITLDAEGGSRLTQAEFAKRRFIRILPFMWLCAIGYNLLSGLGTGAWDWGSALRGLTLWPVGELKPNVLWSLRNEILFYAIFAATILAARRRPWLLAAWLISPLILSTGLVLRPTLLSGLPPWGQELVGVVFGGNSTGANLQFGAGLLLGLARSRGAAWMRPRLPLGLVITVVATAAGTVLIEAAMFWNISEPMRLVLWTVVATAIVWLGVVVKAERNRATAFGLLLGNASYAIYLVHNAFLLVMMEGGERIAAALPPVAFWTLFVLGGIAGGVVVHLLIEAPLLALLSRRLRAPTPVIATAQQS